MPLKDGLSRSPLKDSNIFDEPKENPPAAGSSEDELGEEGDGGRVGEIPDLEANPNPNPNPNPNWRRDT